MRLYAYYYGFKKFHLELYLNAHRGHPWLRYSKLISNILEHYIIHSFTLL